MKQLKLIIAFIFIGLILGSCSEEFEEIENEVEFPETTELITANIQGVINDADGELVDNTTVDILVDGILLASTESINGSYAFQNQAAHPSKTILRAHSKTYAPNFSSISTLVENELAQQDLVVGLLTNKQEYNTSEALIYQPSGEFAVTFVESSFRSEISNVELVSTVFSFPEDNEKLIPNRVGENALGETRMLSLNSVYYVGAFADFENEALLKSDKEFTISIPASVDETLWTYDTTLGIWKEIESFSTETDKYIFSSNKFTYYASVSGDCTTDIDPPVPVCISNVTLAFDEGENEIWAEDIDFNSTDNCSTDLVFEIRKLNDVCANGSDAFGPSILFCDLEIGETVPVRMKVIDEAGNSDYCDVNVVVAGTPDCTNDMIPPTPICINNSTFNVDSDPLQVSAIDFNIGSFDNCSETLDFQVKKIVDLCGNGSDEFSESVTFCPAEIGTTLVLSLLVTDENGNSDSCQISVTITGGSDCTNDTEAPIPYCIQGTTVIVGNDSIEVFATDFDAGSFDNCSQILDFQLSKLTDICSNGSDQYNESVTFCQQEIGSTVALRLLISDENNNSDFCIISVNVE